MPAFEDIEVVNYIDGEEISQYIDVVFEVYCGTCGAGLCGESETRISHNRRCPQVVVNACPKCMKEKDHEIEQLRYEIKELTERIKELESYR